jgi:hypothetical protein
MSGNKVAYEREDAHNDMLSYRDNVRSRDFQDLDAMVYGGVQVDVVRPDTRSDTELQLWSLPEGCQYVEVIMEPDDSLKVIADTFSTRSLVRYL